MSSKIFFHYLTLGDFDGQRVEALTALLQIVGGDKLIIPFC
ncbi:hypothetical protein [Escherichia coli]|nr:hypothetical protein [Enterobacter hormaechei subsp. steigerwaltii]UHA82049.1 hypothetical protein [Enterobacter cloacae]UIX51870.1 hypothetical protein [Enterobacter cloacae subsp. cloacae]